MHHQIGFWHPDSKSTGKSHVTAHLEPQMGNGPRKCICSMGETSKIAVGVPVYNPRTQTDIITDLWVNCSSDFILLLFVSPLKLGMLLSLCLDCQNPWKGSAVSQDSSHISSVLLEVLHSQSGQCPGRLEPRSGACSALSLRPKQDYFPNTLEEDEASFTCPLTHEFFQ